MHYSNCVYYTVKIGPTGEYLSIVHAHETPAWESVSSRAEINFGLLAFKNNW